MLRELRRGTLGVALSHQDGEREAPTEIDVLYMIIEHFREGEARPVYERFRQHGRLAPDGLQYVSSWVTTDLRRCYQVMQCADRALLDQWIAAWSDLVDFEVIPVVTSTEASAQVFAADSKAGT